MLGHNFVCSPLPHDFSKVHVLGRWWTNNSPPFNSPHFAKATPNSVGGALWKPSRAFRQAVFSGFICWRNSWRCPEIVLGCTWCITPVRCLVFVGLLQPLKWMGESRTWGDSGSAGLPPEVEWSNDPPSKKMKNGSLTRRHWGCFLCIQTWGIPYWPLKPWGALDGFEREVTLLHEDRS